MNLVTHGVGERYQEGEPSPKVPFPNRTAANTHVEGAAQQDRKHRIPCPVTELLQRDVKRICGGTRQ
jgi:hypothetical protein